MTWKATTPAEACDLLEWLAGVPVSLSREAFHRLAAERFGWSVEEDDGSSTW